MVCFPVYCFSCENGNIICLHSGYLFILCLSVLIHSFIQSVFWSKWLPCKRCVPIFHVIFLMKQVVILCFLTLFQLKHNVHIVDFRRDVIQFRPSKFSDARLVFLASTCLCRFSSSKCMFIKRLVTKNCIGKQPSCKN